MLIGVELCSFFFQAEDGIRDLTVTGVQTCALPIWNYNAATAAVFTDLGVCREQSEVRVDRRGRGVVVPRPHVGATAERAALASHHETRSEERRVGEE